MNIKELFETSSSDIFNIISRHTSSTWAKFILGNFRPSNHFSSSNILKINGKNLKKLIRELVKLLSGNGSGIVLVQGGKAAVAFKFQYFKVSKSATKSNIEVIAYAYEPNNENISQLEKKFNISKSKEEIHDLFFNKLLAVQPIEAYDLILIKFPDDKITPDINDILYPPEVIIVDKVVETYKKHIAIQIKRLLYKKFYPHKKHILDRLVVQLKNPKRYVNQVWSIVMEKFVKDVRSGSVNIVNTPEGRLKIIQEFIERYLDYCIKELKY